MWWWSRRRVKIIKMLAKIAELNQKGPLAYSMGIDCTGTLIVSISPGIEFRNTCQIQ